MRARFRDLLHRLKKKPDAARILVKEQAGFAAMRSKACRDYDREDSHGFCALRLTEARDFALQAQLFELKPAKSAKGEDDDDDAPETPRKPVARRAPKPAPAAGAPPPPAPGLY